MLITLKVESDDLPDGKENLVIDDEGYDAIGWVDITIGDKTVGVHLSELLPAMKAFGTKYSHQLKESNR